MRATDHRARPPLGTLLLAGFIALSALPASDPSEEGILGDVPMSEGNHSGAEATAEESFIERAVRALTESGLVFARSFSNAPFLPMAFLGGTHYGDATASEEGATPETTGREYQVSSTSQYARVPFLL